MKNLQHVLIIDQQVEQGGEVQPFHLRVNGGGFMLVGDLHEAQVGPIGILAHEFGIDGYPWRAGKAFAELGEGFTVGNQRMNLHKSVVHIMGRRARLAFPFSKSKIRP